MNRLYCIAAAAAVGLIVLPASGVFAQGTAAGAAAAPAAGAAAPATTAAPAATTAAPAATTAAPPAATTTTTAPADKAGEDKGKKKTASKKGSKSELDRSVDSKTVPSRYKSQIPQEYHGYIPWGR